MELINESLKLNPGKNTIKASMLGSKSATTVVQACKTALSEWPELDSKTKSAYIQKIAELKKVASANMGSEIENVPANKKAAAVEKTQAVYQSFAQSIEKLKKIKETPKDKAAEEEPEKEIPDNEKNKEQLEGEIEKIESDLGDLEQQKQSVEQEKGDLAGDQQKAAEEVQKFQRNIKNDETGEFVEENQEKLDAAQEKLDGINDKLNPLRQKAGEINNKTLDLRQKRKDLAFALKELNKKNESYVLNFQQFVNEMHTKDYFSSINESYEFNI